MAIKWDQVAAPNLYSAGLMMDQAREAMFKDSVGNFQKAIDGRMANMKFMNDKRINEKVHGFLRDYAANKTVEELAAEAAERDAAYRNLGLDVQQKIGLGYNDSAHTTAANRFANSVLYSNSRDKHLADQLKARAIASGNAAQYSRANMGNPTYATNLAVQEMFGANISAAESAQQAALDKDLERRKGNASIDQIISSTRGQDIDQHQKIINHANEQFNFMYPKQADMSDEDILNNFKTAYGENPKELANMQRAFARLGTLYPGISNRDKYNIIQGSATNNLIFSDTADPAEIKAQVGLYLNSPERLSQELARAEHLKANAQKGYLQALSYVNSLGLPEGTKKGVLAQMENSWKGSLAQFDQQIADLNGRAKGDNQKDKTGKGTPANAETPATPPVASTKRPPHRWFTPTLGENQNDNWWGAFHTPPGSVPTPSTPVPTTMNPNLRNIATSRPVLPQNIPVPNGVQINPNAPDPYSIFGVRR